MTVTIHTGDALAVLEMLPSDSVQMAVTSPPYFGLRDYGVAGQLGAEATPEAYVANLVAVFRELRRALKDDGTLWLNLGDSYASSRGERIGGSSDFAVRRAAAPAGGKKPPEGLKPKDRMMIPARVALALQADGWWLRDEIVWHKPRTTPSSVKDRTCAAHEMLYMLSKRERYHYDYLAIEEPAAFAGLVRRRGAAFKQHGSAKAAVLAGATQDEVSNAHGESFMVRETKRKRSVWSISPQPYREAHFATFPPNLIRPCILAGSRPGDVVLDPFFGAGTTGLVCQELGRRCIGVELNPEYVRLAEKRLGLLGGVFA
jgi:DNA modification methylase